MHKISKYSLNNEYYENAASFYLTVFKSGDLCYNQKTNGK